MFRSCTPSLLSRLWSSPTHLQGESYSKKPPYHFALGPQIELSSLRFLYSRSPQGHRRAINSIPNVNSVRDLLSLQVRSQSSHQLFSVLQAVSDESFALVARVFADVGSETSTFLVSLTFFARARAYRIALAIH